jgi:hypothetical protein
LKHEEVRDLDSIIIWELGMIEEKKRGAHCEEEIMRQTMFYD